METKHNNASQKKADLPQDKLLAGLPVRESRLMAGKISTSYLEGGEGRPLVLLHGPGESAIWWMRVIPGLVEKYNIIIPDIPGHGSSEIPDEKLTAKLFVDWLDDFLRQTCSEPPVLVGHILGGAIAARYAIRHGRNLNQLVLVNTLGFSSFRPAPRFAFEMLRFMTRPDEKSYSRFLTQCTYDRDGLSAKMGAKWKHFMDYNLDAIRNPAKKAALKRIMSVMTGKIPGEELEKIDIPVKLIWGRYDKVNKLKVAIQTGKKYGWPIRIIENTRDDPKLERPEEFVQALKASIAEPVTEDHA